MGKNELQKQDGAITSKQKNDAEQLNKFLKEHMNGLMTMIEVRVRLMPRIAEKLEFMKGKAVKVCAKARIGRKVGHKKRVFVQISLKNASYLKILDCSR